MKNGAPIVISFYSGDRYYYDAAEQLRSDCDRVGLDSDIVELARQPHETWVDVCRRKVRFYVEMQRKHERPILWLDVDCRITSYPEVLDGAACDLAGFLRGFRYLGGFDPFSVTRFFMPFALFFNNTRKTRDFLALMVRLEEDTKVSATDDYFLQEAWERFDQQLSVLVLSPDLVGTVWPTHGAQIFYFGSSGNVSEFKTQVEQHTVKGLTPARRKAVLVHEADNATKEKKPATL
jgi:hypothetical protein